MSKEKDLRKCREIIKKFEDLVAHMWVHSGYYNNGYKQMTTKQKKFYDKVVKKHLENGGLEL